MTDAFNLNGKVAIVTGAGRGLGRSMALALAGAGARVVAIDLIEENLKSVQLEFSALSNAGEFIGVTGDIRLPQDCRRTIETARQDFGGIDILVNNAGLLPAYVYPGRLLQGAKPGKFWMVDDAVIQNVIETNFIAHDRMTRYVVPHLIEKGWGRIINVTTRLSTMNRRSGSPYGATKAAMEMASEIWCKDLEGTGVTVNILNPGAAADTPGFASPEEKQVATASRRLYMMPPDQMRAPIVWLASNATDGINGMRYDAVAWDATRPAAEQAALHGRPLGFQLRPNARGEVEEVNDEIPAVGTQARVLPS